MGISDILKQKDKIEERPKGKKGVPLGIWSKCAACSEIIYQKEFLKDLKVCPSCKFHYQLNSRERIDSLIDKDTFEEINASLTSKNPLKFKANKTYEESIAQSMNRTSLKEAVVTGYGNLNGRPVVIAVMDFHFIGGTMGSVVGEKITRAIEDAIKLDRPFIAVVASGGARMQEGMFSLMQMAKTSAAIARLAENRTPYISIMSHPTTGGVTASFAALADLIIAEPGALIGFAGPRVIEQTIKEKLPDGFQTSEFLLEHGMVDMVIARPEIKGTITTFIDVIKGEPKRAEKMGKGIINDITSSSEISKQVQKTVRNGTKRIKKGIDRIQDTVRGD